MPNDLTQSREYLVRALEADLIGPYDLPTGPDRCDELLPLPPSRWYLTGFLAPMEAREVENEPLDDGAAAGSDLDDEDAGSDDAGPKRRHLLPASLGLSVLLPARQEGSDDQVRVTLRWADYLAEDHEDSDPTTGESRQRRFWRRQPRLPLSLDLPLDRPQLARGIELPEAAGVWLQGRLEVAAAPGLAAGTRALSLFVVNRRGKGEQGRADERYMFQVSLELECGDGFVPRPNWRGESAEDADELIADLQFRHCTEVAVGHGVAVAVPEVPAGQPVRRVRTTWIPRAEVRRVQSVQVQGLTIGMEELAELDDPEALRRGLEALPAAYESWIAEQATVDPGSDNRRRTRDQLMADAQRASQRVRQGIELLAGDAEARLAFGWMNRAMALQARSARPGMVPEWRLFQLAFLLLNLPSIADPAHPDRQRVELIYFPTGGGKTEAYLGVIAVTLLLRRLRGTGRLDGGDGVAILLRYTLRLLTLDQLGRAATLICALELLRREQPARLGQTRFAIGLWVGRSATANTIKEVARQITAYKNSRGRTASSPFPLSECPWCKTPFEPGSLRVHPQQQPTEVHVHCGADDCPFHVDESPEGLPVLFVDEQIYRELPCFLVATVDKLAMLPWRGETGLLFGRASWRHGRLFYGPLDQPPRDARQLPEGLRPPELIVQDELHLISGPLGTMVGLYETVVEALCRSSDGEGSSYLPKVIAATATVRQATEQVRALFGRTAPPAIFPPPGIDDGETFFATVDRQSPGRLYIGLAAPGRPMKALLLRTYVILLTAAQRLWQERGGDSTADAYMTLVGYFNSLRELGGMRRLVEDEVVSRCRRQTGRHPEGADPRCWWRDRRLAAEPVELTSREATGRIAEAKARLDRGHAERDHVDVLLASNMISVGVDISRLGLMVVAGQPKTTAEYIQASSRVGRQPEDRPGLVVTCFNVYRPRDRSHYEHFTAYHESFYRNVEASSLTPFSGPALERGLAGALVALVRHLDPLMTPGPAVTKLEDHRQLGEAAVAVLVERASRHRSLDQAALRQRTGDLEQIGKALLDSWQLVMEQARGAAGGRRYSPFDLDRSGGPPLLFTVLDETAADRGPEEARFAAPTSMRDVEPTVHLWLERQPLGGGGR